MILATVTSKLFGIPEEHILYPFLRYLFWSNIAIIIMVFVLFVMEVYVHYLKYGWIKEIYSLLTVIKVREQRTIETHEKVDETLQRMENTVKPLIESNPVIAVVPPVTIEVKQDDTKTSDNR